MNKLACHIRRLLTGNVGNTDRYPYTYVGCDRPDLLI